MLAKLEIKRERDLLQLKIDVLDAEIEYRQKLKEFEKFMNQD